MELFSSFPFGFVIADVQKHGILVWAAVTHYYGCSLSNERLCLTVLETEGVQDQGAGRSGVW